MTDALSTGAAAALAAATKLEGQAEAAASAKLGAVKDELGKRFESSAPEPVKRLFGVIEIDSPLVGPCPALALLASW